MDKETFRKMLAEGQVERRRPEAGSVNWPRIISVAIKDGGIYTTKQFWQKFVKEQVNIGRTKMKLHELCDENKKCARLWNGLTYVWVFDKELVKLYHEQASKKGA